MTHLHNAPPSHALLLAMAIIFDLIVFVAVVFVVALGVALRRDSREGL